MSLKVLVVEDHESVGLTIRKTLEDLNVEQVDYAYYCDDAYTYFKNAISQNEPYDLVISDLHFAKDHREQKFKSGKDLSEQIKIDHPTTHVIIFSADNNPSTINYLYEQLNIDGYVKKSRGDARELRKAIETVQKGGKYITHDLILQQRQQSLFEFSEYDIVILTQMIQGKKQKDIAEYLKLNGIQPSALSSIEKRIKQIKTAHRFETNEQMIAYCMKMGIVDYNQ